VRYEIIPSLWRIFNESLTTGTAPKQWMDAIITPLFKKGDKSKKCNYRPVSLTCIICKVMEKLIKKAITSHLMVHNIITETQHGFRKDKSCLSNLLDFFEEIYDCLDKGNSVDILYLDFAKAFDKVPHKRLTKKLYASGIRGCILQWITNWLTDRRQMVQIGNKKSNWIDITSGVPQGSVLGPALFVIYINDIDEGLISKISKFADDTKLCSIVNNEEGANILRTDLEKLYQWSIEWQMPFNIEKCAVMHIGKRNQGFQYKMGENFLRTTDEEKDLGIIVNKNMKTSRQCKGAANKANMMLGFIRRTIISREKCIILNLYKTLVRPHLEYCVQAWSPHLKKDIQVLEKVQRRATKMVRGISHLDYEERLRECGLTTLERRRTRGDLIETFKIIRNGETTSASRFFQIQESSSLRGNQFKIFKKRVQGLKEGFFSNRVVNKWNDLSDKEVTAETLDKFKILLSELGY
jgi:hypothetical protein